MPLMSMNHKAKVKMLLKAHESHVLKNLLLQEAVHLVIFRHALGGPC